MDLNGLKHSSPLCIEREENDISILGSYWVVDSSLFCQKLTLHGKILAGNKTKKNQNFSEILEKVEGEGHLFPWRTIYIMYYSMYIHVVKLAHGIRNGAASVDGVDAKLRQVVPETIQEDVIFKMSAPPKSDAPLITSNDLAEADGLWSNPALLVASGELHNLLVSQPESSTASTGPQGGDQETIE
ncbi:hypothetical protein HID58_014851 [Brassica napus]|uniref:Uncharacterized protein n=1 Tax=Brassica napus TaxID=3708 RepID=A0ABQ8DID9_BRANA|nr:hypothetical protein HID58_014851 [Brassica napus]